MSAPVRKGEHLRASRLEAKITEVLERWPAAGLAVGVVREGSLVWFHGRGVEDVGSKAPITEDTVFRIGSITKTFTAIAVMQLWEQGLLDLDAPAQDYLRSFRLIPAKADFRPVTVRHLLTHTAGIGYWRRLSDLLRPGVGSGDRAGRRVPSLPEYYRRGLPVEVEPGTKWVYSNHGFATLGRIVEDLTGQPFDRYLRDHAFEPLGMEHTDLVRSERVQLHLATGYVVRSRGLKPVVDRDVLTPGGGGVYSTTRDLALYVAALLHGGANEHGSVLKPETLAMMLEPHYQPDPRVPGMGLGFLLGEEGGRRTAGHSGVLSGFLSDMGMVPDEGIGVIVLSNTGGLDGRGAPVLLQVALLRRLLGLPDDAVPTGVPAHPEVWSELCGWYGFDPGPVTNLFMRAVFGAGVEVAVRRGQLVLEPLTPVPAMRKGLPLYPDDEHDPYVFRIDLSDFGNISTLPLVFGHGPGTTAPHLVMGSDVLRRRPDARNPRLWVKGMLAAGAAALVIRGTIGGRRRRTSLKGGRASESSGLDSST
jgi:CubicO group peptidase (beta-lactamase class C family)